MEKLKHLIIGSCLVILIISLGLYFPNEANSQTLICDNSGIKCNVTFEHPEYGKVTVESEKGKDDPALKIIKE